MNREAPITETSKANPHRRPLPIVEKDAKGTHNHPAAVKPAAHRPSEPHLVETIVKTRTAKPESFWCQAAEAIGRGAKLSLIGESIAAGTVGFIAGAAAFLDIAATNGIADISDVVKSVSPNFYDAPENIGLGGIATLATAFALTMMAREKKAAEEPARNFPRAASLVCQIAGAVLPLVAGYAAYQGLERYDAWMNQGANQAITTPQAKAQAAAFTPR